MERYKRIFKENWMAYWVGAIEDKKKSIILIGCETTAAQKLAQNYLESHTNYIIITSNNKVRVSFSEIKTDYERKGYKILQTFSIHLDSIKDIIKHIENKFK